jgi:hypothetical protein
MCKIPWNAFEKHALPWSKLQTAAFLNVRVTRLRCPQRQCLFTKARTEMQQIRATRIKAERIVQGMFIHTATGRTLRSLIDASPSDLLSPKANWI